MKTSTLVCLTLLAGSAARADDMKDLATANNGFSFDLYGKVREKKGNLAFSPFSISTALTMTWAGARGETAAQMRKVLHLEGDAGTVMDASGKLVAAWADPSNHIILRVANRLFGEKSYSFEKAYLDKTRAAFGAPLEPLDFKSAPDPARRHINDWVAKQTNDRIKDLLPPNSIKPLTRLVLVNAVYFLADWATPFKKDATQPAPFFVDGTKPKDLPTMHATEYLGYAEADGVKLLELPYKGNTASMIVVLPDARDGLADVEKLLTVQRFDKWMGALASDRVRVSLPKLTIDMPEPMSLSDELEALGMPLAFRKGQADFSGIANPANPDERLFVSQVFHKAFVKVDEKGTEAAAATAVTMEAAGAMPSKPKEFNADHPFLFFLRDRQTGMILFMGRVTAPIS